MRGVPVTFLFAAWIAVSAGAVSGAVSASDTISGTARVSHTNLIAVDGVPLRLFAIDVLSPDQTCDNGLVVYPCGRVAAGRLTHALVNQTVRCELRDDDGKVENPPAAVCHVGDVDIGEWLVRTGFAFAAPERRAHYAAAEDEARGLDTGIWRGPFVLPWDWRAGSREPSGRDDVPAE